MKIIIEFFSLMKRIIATAIGSIIIAIILIFKK